MRISKVVEKVSNVRKSNRDIGDIEDKELDLQYQGFVTRELSEDLVEDLQVKVDEEVGRGIYTVRVTPKNDYYMEVIFFNQQKNVISRAQSSVYVRVTKDMILVSCSLDGRNKDSDPGFYSRESEDISASDIKKISKDLTSIILSYEGSVLKREAGMNDAGLVKNRLMLSQSADIKNNFEKHLLKEIKDKCHQYGCRVSLEKSWVDDRDFSKANSRNSRGRSNDKYTFIAVLRIRGGKSDGTEEGDLWARNGAAQVVLTASSLSELNNVVSLPLSSMYVYEGGFYGDTLADVAKGPGFSWFTSGLIIEN